MLAFLSDDERAATLAALDLRPRARRQPPPPEAAALERLLPDLGETSLVVEDRITAARSGGSAVKSGSYRRPIG